MLLGHILRGLSGIGCSDAVASPMLYGYQWQTPPDLRQCLAAALVNAISLTPVLVASHALLSHMLLLPPHAVSRIEAPLASTVLLLLLHEELARVP